MSDFRTFNSDNYQNKYGQNKNIMKNNFTDNLSESFKNLKKFFTWLCAQPGFR